MPHWQTILRAISVAFSKSLAAPVVVLFEEHHLGDASGHEHGELGLEIILGVGVAVVEGQLLGQAQGQAARDDRDLVDGVGLGDERGHEGVAGLVVGRVPLFLVADDHALALDAHEDLVLGVLEVLHRDLVLAVAGREQGGLVDQVGQVGAAEAGGRAGQDLEVDVRRPGGSCGRGRRGSPRGP